MSLAKLRKIEAHRVLGVDASTNSLAFCIFEDDHVVFAGIDGVDRLLRQLRRGHFWLQVIGRHLRARDEQPVLAREGRLAAAVEEVRDVGVLLRLGHVQLAMVQAEMQQCKQHM